MKRVYFIIIFILLTSGCSLTTENEKNYQNNNIPSDNILTTEINTETDIANHVDKNVENNLVSESASKLISEPIENSLARVTKKPFGIYITPKNSPVQSEKFSGYHTGADFEIFPGEEEIDVSVYTICAGPLIDKKKVSGYGGVAVQSCVLENENMTVIYGHLKFDSITANIDQNLTLGQKLGVLGKGFSAETDGERKHLHLAIHKGKEINFLGYAQSPELLNQWLDPVKLLGKN